MRSLSALLFLTTAAAAGCGGSTVLDGGSDAAPFDLASADRGGPADLGPAPDLGTAPDLAVPADAAAPSDSAAGDGGKVVVCNLGNDPLPCMNDATCTPNGATCDLAKKYCVCTTPNCTPGMDQTCNDNLMLQSLHGRCVGSGSCQCLNGNMKSMQSGKCL